MTEYIKREDAKNAILTATGCIDCGAKITCNGACDIHAGAVWDVVDNIPAADVRENKRGEWTPERIIYPLSDSDKLCYKCSECHTHWDNKSRFCPYCGAEMGGYYND